MDQEQLQGLEDAYLKQLNQQLQATSPKAVGDWDWPKYEVKSVSAVVIGHRDLPEGGIEVVYVVTIQSNQPIPHAGKALRETAGDGSYTFVQLAASVRSTGYATQLISTYVGTNPYPTGAPVPQKSGAAQARVAPLDGPPTPPHPPP
jgi:hypothetical protein